MSIFSPRRVLRIFLFSGVTALMHIQAATMTQQSYVVNDSSPIVIGDCDERFVTTQVPTSSLTLGTSENATVFSVDFVASQLNYRTIGGAIFAEFAFDVNEPGNAAGGVFQLDDFSLSSTSTGVFYDLGVSTVEFNEVNDDPLTTGGSADSVAFNNGVGDVDVAVFLPVGILSGLNPTDTITLNSQFTGVAGQQDVIVSLGAGDGTAFVIPEPSSSLLILGGLFCLTARRNRSVSR